MKTFAMRACRAHPGLWVAVAVYLVLALSYFFIVPIFEGPDEWTHTGHVKYIAEGNGLPVMLPGRGIWGGQQPPLYYVVAAGLVQPFDLQGVEEYEAHRRNPHASIGYALAPGNKNNYLHSPDEAFPYRGLSLTVHLLRLYSMGYGLAALVFTYLTALELASAGKLSPPGLFATAVALFVAVQPMFGFITASVANEPANIACSAAGLWLAQRYVLRGPSRSPWRAVGLGLALGLASLAKMTGLAVALVAVIALLVTAIRHRRSPGAGWLLWRDGFIIGGLVLAVGGWWYWRNYRLYGDFFQKGLYKIYFNVDPQPLTLRHFLYVLFSSEVSFWATFGWLNIVAPDWVYTVYRIVSRVGLVGTAISIFNFQFPFLNSKLKIQNSKFPAALILHLTFPVIQAFSLTRLVAIEGGMQGRQLLPALGAVAVVVVWGWWSLSPGRWRRGVLAAMLGLLAALALYLPFGVVAPAYIPRPYLTEADLPPDLPRLDWTYGNGDIRLVGVSVKEQTVRPGETVHVTAYWQALRPMETNYSVFVHLFGRDYTNVGQFNTYPGLGLRPTRDIPPGKIVVDTYPVQVNGGADAPARLLVNIGLFDFNEPGRPGLPPVGPDGQTPPSPTVAALKLVPSQWPVAPASPPLADFADSIRLASARLEDCAPGGSTCRLILTWLAQGRPSRDYTVFIQLWQDGQMVAGFDSPPLNNSYPTSLWDTGEVIVDPHRLDLSALPPGRYDLLTGLYDPSTGERLPAARQGTPWPDYAVRLGPLTR